MSKTNRGPSDPPTFVQPIPSAVEEPVNELLTPEFVEAVQALEPEDTQGDDDSEDNQDNQGEE